jgi:hypothetical protein
MSRLRNPPRCPLPPGRATRARRRSTSAAPDAGTASIPRARRQLPRAANRPRERVTCPTPATRSLARTHRSTAAHSRAGPRPQIGTAEAIELSRTCPTRARVGRFAPRFAPARAPRSVYRGLRARPFRRGGARGRRIGLWRVRGAAVQKRSEKRARAEGHAAARVRRGGVQMRGFTTWGRGRRVRWCAVWGDRVELASSPPHLQSQRPAPRCAAGLARARARNRVARCESRRAARFRGAAESAQCAAGGGCILYPPRHREMHHDAFRVQKCISTTKAYFMPASDECILLNALVDSVSDVEVHAPYVQRVRVNTVTSISVP